MRLRKTISIVIILLIVSAGLAFGGDGYQPPGDCKNGNPCKSGCGSGPTGGAGAPSWTVNMVNFNLYMTDTPIWYAPAIGPSVDMSISYNSQGDVTGEEIFGNKWIFRYRSYLTVDAATGNVTIVESDGGEETYTPDGTGGYNRPYRIFDDLAKISDELYELRSPGRMTRVYGAPIAGKIYLSAIKDTHNQAITMAYTGTQLTTVTDASGNVTTLSYNGNGRVNQINGPFGRNALFEYDANGNLTRITDMGGYPTDLEYDADSILTALTGAQGRTEFNIENDIQTTTYPVPDTTYSGINQRITITHPDGEKEEYFYQGTSGTGWHVAPRDYVEYVDSYSNNYTDAPKTYYYYSSTSKGAREAIREIRKPEGDKIIYGIDYYTGLHSSKSDGAGNTVYYTYNDQGRILTETAPNGEVTTYVYDTNDVDLLRIEDGLGTVEMTYNTTHDVTSITDRRGKTTAYTYNAYGQVISITDPLNVATSYTYNADQRLAQIIRDNLTQAEYTYDTIGRVDSLTDASGMTMIYTYSDLDHMIGVEYPDGKSVTYTYDSPCCSSMMTSVTDRAGKTTDYEYNSRKLRTAMTNPEGGITRFEYDLNGNLTRLVDPNNNTTTFEYDLSNRLVKKIYADGKFVAFSYNTASLLASRTNARGTTSSYYYDENSNMTAIEYDDATPGVVYYYDDYNRMTSMEDATGTYNYTYNENGQVLSIDGPWDDDTITYAYDDLGRRTGMTPDGGQARSYQYDPLNRLEQITAGTQAFTYGYNGANPLVETLTRPNGSVTNYKYDNLNRLTEVENQNSAAAIINKYVYTYNNEDQRDSETITNGLAITSFQEGLVQNDYNEVNQILSTINPERTFMHDDDGNLIVGYTPDGYEFTAQYDAENRLKEIEYIDDQSKLHKREYIYRGDWLLAQIKKYEDDALVGDIRMVRDGFLVLQERDASNTVTRQYTWGQNMGGGIGGLLSLSQDGQDYSYLYDGKGNVTSVIDSNNSPVATYAYDPFGKLMMQAGTLDQPFKFSTKRYDAGTGLNYYGYRFYAPVLGRWMNRDPIGVAGGLNLYGFVSNNPTGVLDLWGLACKPVAGDTFVKMGEDPIRTWEEVSRDGYEQAKMLYIARLLATGSPITSIAASLIPKSAFSYTECTTVFGEFAEYIEYWLVCYDECGNEISRDPMAPGLTGKTQRRVISETYNILYIDWRDLLHW